MTAKLNTVGKAVKDYTGFRKVTGIAKFPNDYLIPNMLHAKLLRSIHAHANIIDIDTSQAEAVPGVRLVMTYKNFPDVFFQTVSFNGQEVACIVADDKETAKQATKLIKVQYEVLPFILDPTESMKPDAIQVVPDKPNVVPFRLYRYWKDKDEKGLFTQRILGEYDGYGDIDNGRKNSEFIIEKSGHKVSKQHAPLMGTTTCVADWNGENMTMYINTQNPYSIRMSIAKKMGIPLANICVKSEINSGCFGARLMSGTEPGNCGPSGTTVACVASKILCKPVILEYTRDEEALFYWGRGSFDSRVALGFKRDGTMTMIDNEVWRDGATGSPLGFCTLDYDATPTGTMLYSHNTPDSKSVKHTVLTNSPGWTGWQGFGNPEVFFPVETAMDEAAEKLGIDPVDLRRKNYMQQGDNFLSVAYEFNGPSYVSRSGLDSCIQAGVERTDWYNRRKPASEKTGRIRHGMGMAMCVQQTGGQGFYSQAIVNLMADGSAKLVCNYQDLGQGAHGAQAQIVAETLGIDYDKVKVVAGDSNLPYTCVQSCSSGTVTQGYATYNAALDAKKKLLDRAARLLQVPAEALSTKDGCVFITQKPEVSLPWIVVMMKTIKPEENPIMAGSHAAEEITGYADHTLGEGATSSEQGATFVELDVDTETGMLENIKVYHAQDCGKALNPKVVEGDWQGLHHGVEAATGAEQILDPKTGRLLNDNWIDYPVATILDSYVEPIIIEVADPTHPYGAAGIAQAHQNGILAAISNAIYNAIGIRFTETPFTPERILKALGKI